LPPPSEQVPRQSRSAAAPIEPSLGDRHVVRGKLAPPPLRATAVERPRLAGKLGRALEHPLTLVKADAGYGKSTALAQLAAVRPGSRWYGLGETDRDPLVFLVHLVAAFRGAGEGCGERSLALLSHEGGAAKHWARAADALANDLHDRLDGDVVLVLDDFHVAEGPTIDRIVDRLVEHCPPTLHIVLGTRREPSLPRLARWTASGEVLRLGKEDLAFTADEVAQLFRAHAGRDLAPEVADRLVADTEGWAIALQLLAHNAGATARDAPTAGLRGSVERPDALFDYLAQDVLAEQPDDLRRYVTDVAVLRRMDAELCDALLGRHDSARVLEELEASSLFVTALGGGTYRFHPLFHEFLARGARATTADHWRRLHRRACALHRRRGDAEEAIHHALEAGSDRIAADLLESMAAELVVAGRYETLAAWLARLPEARLDERPELLRAQGDVARLTSRFDLAESSYERARELFAARGDRHGESRALEGEALVYLDTVRPSAAGPLLRRALRLVDRADRKGRAHLLGLLAENSANHGDLDRAQRIRRAAEALEGDFAGPPDPRMRVRQGRLAEARALAERELRREESDPGRGVPRSHRESTAILAWIAAFEGEAENARAYAERALARGRELGAPIVEALALCRLGHGWMTGSEHSVERALAAYRESLALSERLGVDRFRAEALLGMVVLHGQAGRIEQARSSAREALSILDDAGDRYLAAVVWLALGAAGVRADHPDATEWLDRGTHLAARSGDGYCLCVAELWRAALAFRHETWAAFDVAIGRALVTADEQGNSFLLTAHPFLGIKDPAELTAILQAAIRRDAQAPLARRMLLELRPAGAGGCDVPDAPYRVALLGSFRLWHHGREVPAEAWSRDKALGLFQLLVVNRGRGLHREQIQEALWPGARPDASALSLRVALSALHRAVEPDRARDELPRLVRREGTSLRLDTELVWTDVDEFTSLVRQARVADAAGHHEQAIDVLRRALDLYRGDLLEERPYAEWAEEERRSLRDTHLRAASRAAELMVEVEAYDDALEVCDRLLARDPCCEAAYAQQARAHLGLGNRALALRACERCVATLREELDLDPSADVLALRDELLAHST
jgi:LuxR family maltose regulon positive regulatory protein